eukprot:6965220-Alexandrium_andersonii.AAC.1
MRERQIQAARPEQGVATECPRGKPGAQGGRGAAGGRRRIFTASAGRCPGKQSFGLRSSGKQSFGPFRQAACAPAPRR